MGTAKRRCLLAWRTWSRVSARGWYADANSNGRINWIEYARGADPAAADGVSGWPVIVSSDAVGGGMEIAVVLRTDDPALVIVAEASADLETWAWVLRRNGEGEWETNENVVDLVEWQSLGEGLHEARLRALGSAGVFFVRMKVDYLP